MADLGGVPRVPELPLVELDTGQAPGCRLRQCVCMLRTWCTHAPVTHSCIEMAVVVDSP